MVVVVVVLNSMVCVRFECSSFVCFVCYVIMKYILNVMLMLSISGSVMMFVKFSDMLSMMYILSVMMFDMSSGISVCSMLLKWCNVIYSRIVIEMID